MRASKQIADDIGGSFKSSPAIANVTANAPSEEVDPEENLDIYSDVAVVPSIRKLRNVRNRLKAKAMAETRLSQIAEELSVLADELRHLNPLMAEALDDAWQSTDEAIEILLDDHAW